MARSSNGWSRSADGALWVPTRRAVVSGVTAGAASLLLGCGQSGKGTPGAGGEGGSEMSGGTGGLGTGGRATGGMSGSTGGMTGTGGAGDGTGGAGTGGMGTGGAGTGGSGTGGAAGPDGGTMAGPDAQAGTELACTTRSEQIVGPFPAPNVQLNRADIRSDPGDNNLVKPGVPMKVVLKVGQKQGTRCVPMKGAVINIWQCDAGGLYSGYSSEGSGKNQFLRGYQMTDGSGVVEFTTIYPGSYSGRCVHNHFSVRMNGMVSFPSGGFVGQMYFPDEVTDEVLKMAPYKATGRTRNSQDGFYKKDMLATVTRMGGTWVAELELAV